LHGCEGDVQAFGDGLGGKVDFVSSLAEGVDDWIESAFGLAVFP
jgi:hypothetical protein